MPYCCFSSWNWVKFPRPFLSLDSTDVMWVAANWMGQKLPQIGLSDPAPTSAPSKKSHSRISWMGWNCSPGVSLPGQYFFFFFWSFFFQPNFYSLFLSSVFFWGGRTVFYSTFFLGSSYIPPFFLPMHLPPSCCWPLPTPPFVLTSSTH
jgi:hypothetical protein